MLRLLKGTRESRLRKKYRRLLKEAYGLSHSNRRLSDAIYAEAQEIMDEIDYLNKNTGT